MPDCFVVPRFTFDDHKSRKSYDNEDDIPSMPIMSKNMTPTDEIQPFHTSFSSLVSCRVFLMAYDTQDPDDAPNRHQGNGLASCMYY